MSLLREFSILFMPPPCTVTVKIYVMMTGVFVITSSLFCLPQPLTGCGSRVMCFAYVCFWLRNHLKRTQALGHSPVHFPSPECIRIIKKISCCVVMSGDL